LVREIDRVLSDEALDRRTRLITAMELVTRVWESIRDYRPKNPWAEVNAALGAEPLKQEGMVNDLLDTLTSGGIAGWCFEWIRKR
jgi:hypothetical protein